MAWGLLFGAVFMLFAAITRKRATNAVPAGLTQAELDQEIPCGLCLVAARRGALTPQRVHPLCLMRHRRGLSPTPISNALHTGNADLFSDCDCALCVRKIA